VCVWPISSVHPNKLTWECSWNYEIKAISTWLYPRYNLNHIPSLIFVGCDVRAMRLTNSTTDARVYLSVGLSKEWKEERSLTAPGLRSWILDRISDTNETQDLHRYRCKSTFRELDKWLPVSWWWVARSTMDPPDVTKDVTAKKLNVLYRNILAIH